MKSNIPTSCVIIALLVLFLFGLKKGDMNILFELLCIIVIGFLCTLLLVKLFRYFKNLF